MLSMPQVHALLDPIQPILVAAHLGAAERVKTIAQGPATAEAINALNLVERANFYHGQIRQLVAVGIEPLPNVNVTSWAVDTIAVGTNLLVRFSYLGGEGPDYRKTEQQRLLAQQQYKPEAMELLSLAGITEPPTTVVCGHTLRGLDISRVVLRRDCLGHDQWSYDIYGGEAVVDPQRFTGIDEAKPAVVRSKTSATGAAQRPSVGQA